MNKPEIRINKFEGEWETHPLNDFFSKVTNKNTNMNYSAVLTNSAEHGIINQNDYFDFDVANSNNIGGYYIVHPDDFVYNPRVSVTAPVGPINRNLLGYTGVVSPLYLVFQINGINKDFLCHYYKTNKWHRFMRLSGNCGARFDRLSISDEQFVQMPISYPKNQIEQKAICDCLDNVDKLIKSATSRLASLKQIRTASLLAMFPQDGKTIPQIRFGKFDGEWKRKTLAQCLSVSNKKNTKGEYGKEDVLSVSDEFGICNQIELLGRSYAGTSVENYGIVNTGDIVYTKSPLKSKPFGIIKANHGRKGIVSTLYAVYSPNENTNSRYIELYFDLPQRMNKYIHPLVNKGAKNDMKVSGENALKGTIYIPNIAEQNAIASYFDALDKNITFQVKLIEKLKHIKSACLDKMFV